MNPPAFIVVPKRNANKQQNKHAKEAQIPLQFTLFLPLSI